jgi:four helix bundle protein
MNSEILKTRTKGLAIDVIKFTRRLPMSTESRIIVNQLIRSSTSTASNYRAALRARSDAEFYAKLSIVVEEADETLFWLELIEEAKIYNSDELLSLKKEATEILYIFSATRKSIKSSISDRKSNQY